MSVSPYFPAILAAVTDAGTGVFVHQHQPDYPIQFVAFQLVMFGAAFLVAAPKQWLRLGAFLALLCGVLLASMTVGMFYLPTLITAWWVMARLGSDEAVPSFRDRIPQHGIIYTASELEVMRNRQR